MRLKNPKRKSEEKTKIDAAPDASEEKPKRKNLMKIESTQMWSPVKFIKDGIVATKDGRFVQILEFSPVNFLLLPEREQEEIADAFGAGIRTFPKRFQIKVLSRKADIATHIKTLTDCMKRERNANCRKLQEDAVQQIKKDATSGISRRFLIAFPYEAPGSLRRPEWNEIASSLRFNAYQIINTLSSEPCDNELLSPVGDSDHAIDVLYNCMCRSEAAIKPTEVKISDIICSHIIEHGYDPSSPIEIPINDYLTPRCIDPSHFSYLEVDGKFYCFGYIHQDSYPTTCVAGWLSTLVNMGEGIDLDVWVEQKPTAEIATKLSYAKC